jgi:hypothetical protein
MEIKINGDQYKEAVDLWFRFYHYKMTGNGTQETQGQVKPQFTGVEGKKLKEILKHLKNYYENPNTIFKHILINWDKLDPWIQQNALDLKIFHSKLNIILISLKNGKQTREAAKQRFANYQ